MKRLLPAVVLLVLAPFVGEVLLGNLPLSRPEALAALPALCVLYGGGAVLVRETARRLGRGYPTILLLALAYGIVEEGLVVQTLFNGAYLGNDLHSYGELPALGMGLPWTFSVLTLHSIWSIAVPIAVVESLFPGRGPWLRVPGTVVTATLFVLGALAATAGTAYSEQFFARPAQLVGAAVAAVIAVVLGVTRPRVVADVDRAVPRLPARRAPRPLVTGAVTFAAGSAFFAVYFAGQHLHLVPAPLTVLAYVAVHALGLGALGTFSRRPGWTPAHVFAAGAGAMLVYCWAGFGVSSSQPQTTAGWVAVQAVTAAVAIVVLTIARRTVSPAGSSPAM